MEILGNPVPMHKVGETKDSVIVSGARILATLAPYSDELAVYPGFPLARTAPRTTPSASRSPWTRPG